MLAGAFDPGTGWTSSTLSGATNDAPAVALINATTAVGLIRSTANGGELRFTTWSGGSWSPLAALGTGVTTRAAPALATTGTSASAVFHGDDFKHYFGKYASSWSPIAEPVGGAAQQSFGPSPAGIAPIGSDAVIAFAGNDHDLYDQRRVGGVWQGAQAHALGGVITLSPTIVATSGNLDLMIAFVRNTDARIVYITHGGAGWSAPAVVDTNALTNDPVSLAALPGGGAVLGYRGQNGKIYWSRFTASATPPWSPPTGITATNFDTPAPPAVAPGISGADAEMVFIDAASGSAKHARLNGTTWSAPTTIGGSGLTRVAAASY